MLFMTPHHIDMLRIQSPLISNKDIEALVKELKQNGEAEYEIDVEALMIEDNAVVETTPDLFTDSSTDPIFPEALKLAVDNGEVSASYLQRVLRIGFNRASRIVEAMDKMKEDLVNYI